MMQWILIPSTILMMLLGGTTAPTSGMNGTASQTQTQTQTQNQDQTQTQTQTQTQEQLRTAALQQWMNRYTVRLFNSEQGYHMYVLPGFEAAGEEPGRDVVMDLSIPENFMRIQMLPQKVNLASVRQNIVTELKDLGTPKQVTPKSVFADPFLQRATYMYIVQGKGVTKTAMVMNIGGTYFRIAITTKLGAATPDGIFGPSLLAPGKGGAPQWATDQAPYFRMIRSISTGKVNTPTPPGIVAGSVEPKLYETTSSTASTRQFIFQVKNQMEVPQQLTFNTTQQYEYTLSQNGMVVQKYSWGKMFGQLVNSKTLVQGQELSYVFNFSNLAPGDYTLEAWLTTTNANADKHATLNFTVK